MGTLAAIWLVTGCDNSSTSLAPSPSSPPASTCVTLPEAPPRELTRFGAGTVGGLLLVDSSGIYTSSDSATHYRLTKNKLGKSPVIVAKELDRPEVIAMDATNIYWGGTGKTLAIPKTGGKPVDLTASWVEGLAADSSGVYWTTDRALLMRRDLKTPPVTLVDSIGGTRALAVDAGFVYVGTLSGLSKVSKSTKSVTTFGSSAVKLIALDDGVIYASDTETLWKMNTDGSSVTMLMPSSPCGVIMDIASFGAYVYLTCEVIRRYSTDKDGTIIAVPKTGGCAVSVVSKIDWPEKLAVHDGALYWTDRNSLGRLVP